MTRHAILIMTLLPLAACASNTAPQARGPAAGGGDAYQEMSCDQLAAAARDAASDLAWSRRQQQVTFAGDTTSNVTFSMPIGGSGGSSASPNASRAQSQQTALREAMTAKGCG